MRRTLYGWRIPGGYCLSKIPPDLPQLARETYATIDEAEAAASMARRRTEVIWCGPALVEKQRLEAA